MVSRKKKRCLLVMGLCGVALIVDRLTPTNSSTVPAAAQAAPTRPIVNTAAEGAADPYRPFAHHTIF